MDDVTEKLLLYCSIDIIMIPANIKKEKKKKLNISILSSYSNYRQTQLLERYDIVEFELANKKNTNKKGSWHQKKNEDISTSMYLFVYVFTFIFAIKREAGNAGVSNRIKPLHLFIIYIPICVCICISFCICIYVFVSW